MIRNPLNIQDLKAEIQSLSAALLRARPSDLPALADLHSRIEEVGRWAGAAGRPEVVSAAADCAALVEKVVLEEVPDPAGALAEGARTLSGPMSGASPSAPMGPAGGEPEGDAPPAAGGDPGKALAADLSGEFISEAMELLDDADLHLLALENDPTCEEALNGVFRTFHTLKGNAGCLGLPDILSFAHRVEGLLERARKGQLRLEGDALGAAFEAVDALRKMVERLRGSPCPSPREEERSLALLCERIERLSRSRASASPAPAAGEDGRAPSGPAPPAPPLDTVRVDRDRLDRLMDAIGELVVAGSTVVQAPPLREAAPADLARDLGRLAKAIRELQELGNSLRMVPVRGTFQRMARMARDLARSLGKPIHFITSGEETELDKAMVDRVADPLIHMVRNAIDHGLEASAEDRRRAGKPEAGSVRLGAFHRGGRVHIEIEDDGRGIDLEGVAAKARENGLLPPGKALDERALLALIFAPGFSTAREVTAVSGRGVGLDVVKRNVESLRGQVEVRSRPGKGTVFTLKLPLTLAIIDGLVVSVGTRRFVIPTLSVVRSICPGKGDLSTALGRGEMVDLQDSTVALLRPAGLLGVRGASEDPTRGVVVLVAEGRRRAGLLVDSLAGREQIVIKSLGEDLDRIPGISGGALLPGGQLGLVLDVGGLLDLAEKCGDGVPQEVTAGETRGREVHQPIH